MNSGTRFFDGNDKENGDVVAGADAYIGEGVEIAGSPGRNLVPLMRGAGVATWADEAFFEAETARAIRTRLASPDDISSTDRSAR